MEYAFLAFIVVSICSIALLYGMEEIADSLDEINNKLKKISHEIKKRRIK